MSQIEEGCERAIFTLHESEEQAITQQINQVIAQLEKLQQYDSKIETVLRMLNDGLIQIEEGANELRHHLSGMDMDPERLEFVDARLGQIHDISRKHRINPKEIASLIAKAEQTYFNAASKLTAGRQKAAKKQEKQVTENVHQLGMPNGKFVIDFTALENISAAGQERVEFQVTMNPGQPLKPLTKVASGGELSRISLAIHVITAATGRIPTLIFDEVDVGIGGGTAEVVGRMLRDLSEDRQVLCVTHQPNNKQRIDEVARMLGGIEITSQTLSHARDMIKRSQSEPA